MPKIRKESIKIHSKIILEKVMQKALKNHENGPKMEPKSIQNPLKIYPKIDVEKWTPQATFSALGRSKGRFVLIFGRPFFDIDFWIDF